MKTRPNKKLSLLLLLIINLLIITACSTRSESIVPGQAEAKMYSQKGKYIGSVKFNNDQGQVKIIGDFKNLAPNSKLGFHVHEKGICAGDFTSSGGHFNPTKLPHGAPGVASHVGDLGNITTDKKGNSHYENISEQISLIDDESAVVGKAVIIHSGPDDFVSQPSGDSGKRIACGIITI